LRFLLRCGATQEVWPGVAIRSTPPALSRQQRLHPCRPCRTRQERSRRIRGPLDGKPGPLGHGSSYKRPRPGAKPASHCWTYRGQVAARSRWIALVLGAVLALGACESSASGSAEPPRRFDPIGAEVTPAAPLMPVNLPAGWLIVDRDYESMRLVENAQEASDKGRRQSLFMPEGATSASGPALIVGYVGDDEAEPSYCLPSDRHQLPTAGPTGSNSAYVFGRGVSKPDLAGAAGSVRWGTGAPHVRLPSGFSLRASSNLPANGLPSFAWLHVQAPSGALVYVGEEQTNRAGVAVAKFWRSALDRTCTDSLQRTVVRGGTIVRLIATDTPEARRMVRTIARKLRHVSAAEFCERRCVHFVKPVEVHVRP
jgi:hypothetical protein